MNSIVNINLETVRKYRNSDTCSFVRKGLEIGNSYIIDANLLKFNREIEPLIMFDICTMCKKELILRQALSKFMSCSNLKEQVFSASIENVALFKYINKQRDSNVFITICPYLDMEDLLISQVENDIIEDVIKELI